MRMHMHMCVLVWENLIFSSHLGTALLVKLIFMEISKTRKMTLECATILVEHDIRMCISDHDADFILCH